MQSQYNFTIKRPFTKSLDSTALNALQKFQIVFFINIFFYEITASIRLFSPFVKDGWMICDFTSFLFKAYLYDARMIMKDVCNGISVYGWNDLRLMRGLNAGPLETGAHKAKQGKGQEVAISQRIAKKLLLIMHKSPAKS